MARRFKDMQTPEQQYAAGQVPTRAHALRQEAQAALDEAGRLTAPRRREGQRGRVLPEFGPHSDRDGARVDQLRAKARDLRAAADAAEAPAPKPKRRWF
ncbi:hypothetical protein [Streptomyces dengpaensis]|nr:hypothetical protein [Streptomyces dengpaensis]